MTPGRLCILIFLGATIAACASGPKLARVEVPAVSPTLARVYFYRTMRLASTMQPPIALNGQEVGTCKPGGVFFWDVAPGTLQATVGAAADYGRTFTLAAGEEKYLRCSIAIDSLAPHGLLQVVAPEEAHEEMHDLAFTGRTARQPQ